MFDWALNMPLGDKENDTKMYFLHCVDSKPFFQNKTSDPLIFNDAVQTDKKTCPKEQD